MISGILLLTFLGIYQIFLLFHPDIRLPSNDNYSKAHCIWSFGFGSNMDVTHLTIKKNLTIFGKIAVGTRAIHVHRAWAGVMQMLGVKIHFVS
jgi:hypothetical protein